MSRVFSRRWRVPVVLLVVTVLVIAIAALVINQRSETSTGLASTAEVSASSVALGTSPRDAVVPASESQSGPGWQSERETGGAWIELQWKRRHLLRHVVIVRNSLDQRGVTSGFLSFSDGSDLQLQLSRVSPRTVVPIGARSVDRMRFTASQVDDGATNVTIARIEVDGLSRADDVATDASPDGDVAESASVTTDDESGSSEAGALLGGRSRTGTGWTVPRPAGAWVQLDWPRARELTTIEIHGSAESKAALSSGSLVFSDGARLPLGAVLNDPTRPTRISFMTRVTTSLRLDIETVDGTGPLVLDGLRAYQRGARLERLARGVPGRAVHVAPATCGRQVPARRSARLVVLCPTNGSRAWHNVTLQVSAPDHSTVSATVWSAEPDASVPASVEAPTRTDGTASLDLDLMDVAPGPVTVRLDARGGSQPPAVAYFQLYRAGRDADDADVSSASRGHSLVYDEQFDRPVSLSRTGLGADYAAAKPTSSGAEDFGSAIFPDPVAGLRTVQVVDNRYLRIQTRPRPRGYKDPQGWRRRHVGGLLASARQGGSGFSAQYGYFEARMLAPAGPGTWPAFWMLPSDNLVTPQSTVAEIDAVELYGHELTGACHTSHEYGGAKDRGVARCGTRFASDRAALAWHTYGVSVGPTTISYFIDDRLVATAPQVRGGEAPMFFLLDLALGGGWPIDLSATRGRADLYVDYVRVYV